MKSLIDIFPETPEGFHLRMEETLSSLEEREMINVKVYSRRMVAVVAAILVLALAATAVAVVQGNSLRTRMDESGGEQLAAQVQDVHVSDAENDFSFTIDEILWEGEQMYVSYTVTVPDDGKVYLFSPTQIELNGEAINRDFGVDAEFFTCLFALGGEYGTSVSKIMQLQVREDLGGEQQFSCKCLFMQAKKPLVEVGIDEFNTLFTEPDAYGNENQMLRNADILYYSNVTNDGDAAPAIYLHYYPEVRTVMDGNSLVTAEALEETGIAEIADMREISILIHESEGEAIKFNDVSQHVFDMEGYSIEIVQLNLSHFNMGFEALIRKDDGEIVEWTEAEPYAQWYFLCNADGSDLGMHSGWSMGGGEVDLLENGECVYRVDGCGQGIYPVESIAEVYLAPEIYDENGEFVGRDMSRAVKLTPIWNPDLPESTPEPEVDFAETDDLSS